MRIEEHNCYGNCLEGIGIPNKGIAVIDRDMKPSVGDVIWCSGCIGGEIGGFLKQIVDTGPHPVVQTRYVDSSKNYMFFPKEIYGVVLKVLDKERNVVWERSESVKALPAHWIDVIYRSDWQCMVATCSGCRVRGEIRFKRDDFGNAIPDSPYCPACGIPMEIS